MQGFCYNVSTNTRKGENLRVKIFITVQAFPSYNGNFCYIFKKYLDLKSKANYNKE